MDAVTEPGYPPYSAPDGHPQAPGTLGGPAVPALPQYPRHQLPVGPTTPTPYRSGRWASPQWPTLQPDPGWIPLRPLRAGEIIGNGFRVAWRHFGALGSLAFLTSLSVTATIIAVLAASGQLHSSVDYLTSPVDPVTLGQPDPSGWLTLALLAGLVIGQFGGTALAGVASAYAGADAMGDPREARRRLAGRIAVLVWVSAVVGLLVSLGLLLLLIPGLVLCYLWLVAAPVSVMERRRAGGSLRRSLDLTRGHRWRIVGIQLLMSLISVGIYLGISLLFGVVFRGYSFLAGGPSAGWELSGVEAAAAIAGALVGAWSAAVIAVIYIDLRVRKENLGEMLRAIPQLGTFAR